MFAKRAKPSSQSLPPPHGGQAAESGVDPRDEQIERLEREVAEQRDAAKSLREALDAATFKIEILEKSYATQLAEVRDKRAELDAELKEKDEILANLGGGHEHTLRELNDALTVIKVLKTERDQLRKQIAQGGFRPHGESKARRLVGSDANTSTTTSSTSDDDTSGGTINALIANDGWTEKKPAVGTGQATAQVETEQEPAQHEMLSPDLVFTTKDKEAEDER
jgi:chromosome segregation ATPase